MLVSLTKPSPAIVSLFCQCLIGKPDILCVCVCVCTCPGPHYLFRTLGSVNQEGFWFTTHRTSLVFEVQASHDAKISFHNGTDYEYEVIIGWDINQKTIIRRADRQGTPAVADTPAILSATSLRTFWVENSGEEIRVGRGMLGEGLIVQDLINPMTLRAISVSTANVFGT